MESSAVYKMSRVTSFALVALVALDVVVGSRILFMVGMSSKSQRGMFDPISEELAKRGHEIVFVSLYPSNRNVTNVREIDPQIDTSTMNGNVFKKDSGGAMSNPFKKVFVTFAEIAAGILKSPNVQELFDPNTKFDLVILNAVFNDYALGLIHLYKVPFIYLYTGPTGAFPWANSIIGNPFNPAVDPNMLLEYTPRMTFFQRVVNTISLSIFTAAREYIMMPWLTYKAREIFGEDLPPLGEIERNVSLIFSVGHHSFGHPRPNLPNMVDIGGVNCHKAKPLPKDLAAFLDGSGEHGVIFFSFGSVVTPSHMPEEMKQGILRIFAKLPQRVVWKWNEDSIEGLPSNVKLGKWLPQQDILGHPKVRLFITHGGWHSTMEAVYHGVPVIGFPFYSDQFGNVRYMVRSGYGVEMNWEKFTEERFTEAIHSVLNNKSMSENIKRGSELLRDQDTDPLDRAAYWVEYILRHKGAPHLRSAAADLSWIQLNLFDVYAFLILVCTLSTVIFYYLTRTVCRFLCGCCAGKKNDKLKSS